MKGISLRTTVLLLVAAFAGIMLVSAVRADDGNASRATRAEVRFLEGMSDHHQMAVDMAQDCLQKAVTDELRQVCQGIIDAQSAEIKTMHDWLLSWYGIDYSTTPMVASDMSVMATPEMSGMDMTEMAGMPQVATDPSGMMGMFAGFNRLEDKAYEVAWLESMIDHHDDALHMANRVLKVATHPELIALAHNIITNQTAEIAHMETMLTERGDA